MSGTEINRNNLLEYKEKKINKRVPLVLTYHPSLEKISGIVRHYWKEIEKSETIHSFVEWLDTFSYVL
jgi:hypothetical protein